MVADQLLEEVVISVIVCLWMKLSLNLTTACEIFFIDHAGMTSRRVHFAYESFILSAKGISAVGPFLPDTVFHFLKYLGEN